MRIEALVRQIAICHDAILNVSKIMCDRGASTEIKDVAHKKYLNLEKERSRLTTLWYKELIDRDTATKGGNHDEGV
jgi:hypothetical protein